MNDLFKNGVKQGFARQGGEFESHPLRHLICRFRCSRHKKKEQAHDINPEPVPFIMEVFYWIKVLDTSEPSKLNIYRYVFALLLPLKL